MRIETRTPTGARPRRLGGRYALLNQIGAGGMGSVYLARLVAAAGFERIVAVKRVNADLIADPQTLSMFKEEVRLTARIRHPNVPAALDVVEDEGELWLVMEYVHGANLPLLLQNWGDARGLTPRIAAAVCVGVLSGLHAAHEATDSAGRALNIVHRDVSPQNVLVGRDGHSRIIDFGVARAVGQSSNTMVGQIKGKLAYLAPERLTGTELDRRADVYGASIVLWEMLTGLKLFETNARADVIEKVISAHVVPPSSLVPGIPPELEAIVLRGLQKEPDDRFQTARDMAIALTRDCDVATPEDVAEWMARTAGPWLAQRDRELLAADALTFTPNPLELQAAADSGARPPPRPPLPHFDEHTRIAPIRPMSPDLVDLEPAGPIRAIDPPRPPPRTEPKLPTAAQSAIRQALSTTKGVVIARRGALILTTCILVGLFAGTQLGNAASDGPEESVTRAASSSRPAPVSHQLSKPAETASAVLAAPSAAAPTSAPSGDVAASPASPSAPSPHPASVGGAPAQVGVIRAVSRPVSAKRGAVAPSIARKSAKGGPDGF